MATAAVLRPTHSFILTPITAAKEPCCSRVAVRTKPACGGKEKSSQIPCRQQRRRRPQDEKRKLLKRAETERTTVKETVETREMVLGKVRILKRGENLNPNLIEKKEDAVVCSSGRPMLAPVAVVKRIPVCEKEALLKHQFAGCAYLLCSPLPTSVPVPKFAFLPSSDKIQ